mmetsp:Transcript_13324/g.18630  ORF Transcript_13324/g.18630 Transcript_13324/m.18630 type:complete len:154 (+) Transcript_13324:1108-1569(+)
MLQQLEEQQDFGSQAVQGHEQKQERKGDTDAKEGGGTPPQAPPGPAPGIKKADAAAEALENFYEADDEDVAAESKKVVMALRALRPRASNYAKLQSGQLCLGTTGVWAPRGGRPRAPSSSSSRYSGTPSSCLYETGRTRIRQLLETLPRASRI